MSYNHEQRRKTQAGFVLSHITIETFTVAATCHVQYENKEKEETAAKVSFL